MRILPDAHRPSRLDALLVLVAVTVAAWPVRGSTSPACAGSEEYRARRGRVLEQLAASGEVGDGVLLLRSSPPDRFANDVFYPYRPDNDLYYLTGIAQPGCALLLSTAPFGDHGRELLFLEPRDPTVEVWIGRRLSRADASRISGVPESAVLPLAELDARVEQGVKKGSESPRLYFETGKPSAPGRPLSGPYRYLLSVLGSRAFHVDLRPPGTLIHPLRQIKSAAEIACLRRAIDATVEALLKAMQHARPGLHEFDLRAVIEATFLRRGCAGWAFPPIVGSGANSCILHYEEYDRRLEAGDLVLMDIGAECGFYAADVTRTFPVSGRFTPRQKEIYEIVLAAQLAGIAEVRPGGSPHRVTAAARRVVARGLVRIGLIDNEADVGRYFLHGASHGIGLAVHDPMPVRRLSPGMTVTVEPGIYIPEEAIGIRIEDDVLVTTDRPEVLSAGAPKTVEVIEALMAGRRF